MTKQSLFVPRGRSASSKGPPVAAAPSPSARPGPAGGTRDRNRRERIASLEQAGLRLFLERGVGGVTVDALVGEAGMAKGNFYRYFEDIEALVQHLIAPVEAGAMGAFEACDAALRVARSREDLVRAYEGLAGALAITVLAAPDVVRLYLQESRGAGSGARSPIAKLATRLRVHALRLTEAARAHGLQRAIPSLVSAHAVVGAVEELVFVALSGADGGALGDPSTVAAALVDLVLDGVRAR